MGVHLSLTLAFSFASLKNAKDCEHMSPEQWMPACDLVGYDSLRTGLEDTSF